MAEVVTGEFSRYRSNLIDMHVDLRVYLWDCGPEKPVLPTRPKPPEGVEGDPEYDLAVLEFQEVFETYSAALKTHRQRVAEYADWELRHGGPIEHGFWSCDARDALQNDARAVAEGRQVRPRWHLSSRTRGYEKLPNHGLPAGMIAGRGHDANVERQRQGAELLEQARRADPVFGDAT
jgi:hypothetical protein